MTRTLFVAALACIAIVPLSTAGSLTPPGPPAPTMKALDVVEPRIPISALPFTISAGGSYYLTGNLTLTVVGHGIQVVADDVSLDLNGYTLTGTAGYAGVYVSGGYTASIRNGTLRGWGQGVFAVASSKVRLADLTAVGNGIGLSLSGSGSIRDCLVTGSVTHGIYVAGDVTIRNTSVLQNGGEGIRADGFGNVIENCTAVGNTGDGFSLAESGRIVESVARSNQAHGIISFKNNFIARNGAYFNGFSGIQVTGEGCRIEENNTMNNVHYGIELFATPNAVLKNASHANAFGNYSPAPTGTIMPIDTTGTSTNPWVNFSY